MLEKYFIRDNMEEEEQNIIKKKMEEVLKKKQDETAREYQLTIKAERPKIIALDVLIGITVVVYFIRFIFFPFVLKIYPVEYKKLHKVLKKHFTNVFNGYFNIFLFCIFIALLVIYFSFDNLNFKHMGIILLIAYITSLAVEAELFITGAVLNAIIVFIYIRVLLIKNEKEQEADRKKQKEKERKEEERVIRMMRNFN